MAEKLKRLLSNVKTYTGSDFFNIPFDFLAVDSCNADECHSFSQDIILKLSIKSEFDPLICSYLGKSLCEVYLESVFSVLLGAGEKFADILDLRQRKAVETLIDFIKNIEEDGNHLKCLKELCTNSDPQISEAQIQAVLACHLFSPLLTEGEVIVDNKCYRNNDSFGDPGTSGSTSSLPKAECPFCNESLKKDNTNFGVKDLWHGSANIVVKARNSREIVTIVEEVEEEEEEHGVESCAKCAKLDYLAELKSSIPEQPLKYYKQAISQTIVNAFLAVKHNRNLENVLIPSFLVCQSSVYINFYNVNQDVLLVQSLPMKLIKGGINYAAFFSVWMALNFEIFHSEKNAEIDYNTAEKSGFKSFLKDKGVLIKYENEIEDNFTTTKSMTNATDEECRTHIVFNKEELLQKYASMIKR